MDLDLANDGAHPAFQCGQALLLTQSVCLRQSRKQVLITMATVEGKYIPSSDGSCEEKWLLKLHSDMHGKDASQVPSNCNN